MIIDSHPIMEEFAEVVGSKCSKNDLDACVAWATIRLNDEPPHSRSCSLGITGSCTFGAVPLQIREEAYEQFQDPWTCYAAYGGTQYCDLGVWPACDPVTWPKERWASIKWAQRLMIKPAELTRAWENLEVGREAIRKANLSLWPTPMPLSEIDQTFGAACNSEIAYGCTEGANAAVNVQLKFRTQDRIDHAQKLLNRGCENGDYLACSLLLSVAETSPENAIKLAQRACYSAPRGVQSYPYLCRTYAHLWMAEVGFTPWLMDTTLAKPAMAKKCAEQKDEFLCLAAEQPVQPRVCGERVARAGRV